MKPQIQIPILLGWGEKERKKNKANNNPIYLYAIVFLSLDSAHERKHLIFIFWSLAYFT
jgi:hypothetical protein